MAYKPPKQTIVDNDLKNVPSNEAVFEALKLKLPKPSVDGTNGQLLARGASADDTSWVNPPATGANTSLSNLSSVAINDNLAFNKATAATLSASDSKATQANHDFTIRAGNTGSAVNGGNLNLYAGTSGSGNGGNIYLRLDGGTTTSTRRIYFIGTGGQTLFEIGGGSTVQLNNNLTVGTDNTYSVGAETTRLQYLWYTTALYAGPSGVISGFEKISDNGAAAGSLTVRGGNAANSSGARGINPGGNLTLQGGDHPGASGSQATPAAGNITVRGGNRTAGTGNGGSVTIAGGTSSGGTAGEILFTTAGSEQVRIKTDGKVGIGTATPGEKLEVNGSIQATTGDLKTATAGYGLAIKTGANAKIGTAQFTAQSVVTVNTTAVTANSLIFVTGQDGVNSYAVQNKVAGTSFQIHHVGGNTTSLVAWMIVEATP